jgi:hypothetical protein
MIFSILFEVVALIMLSKIKFLFGLKKGLMVRNAQSLSCYECNSLMSVGCDNPANSGSYFYNFCGLVP